MIFADTDLAWAAGFLEGEACFHIRIMRGGRNVACTVAVNQVDKAPLERLQTLFGGSLNRVPPVGNHSAKYVWTVTTNFVRNTLPSIIPFMVGAKRHEAEFVAEFARTLGKPISKPLSEEEVYRRIVANETLVMMRRERTHYAL